MGEPATPPTITIYQRPRLVGQGPRSHAINENMFFRDAAPIWLETRKPFLAERTAEDYRHYISRLADYFGGIVLGNIDAEHLREYQRLRTAGGCGPSVINHETGIVQKVLKRIGRWRQISDDFQSLPLPKETRGRCIEDWERERYLRVAALNPAWEVAYCATRILSKTGICQGELCQVRLKDINAEQKALRILFGKNKYRERWVPLTDDPWAAVQQLLARAERLGSTEPGHYLLPFRIKTRTYDPTRPTKGWRGADEEICAAADVSFRRHDWRHTVATRLLESPETSTETAIAILGHVSEKMVRRVYNHTRIQVMRAAMESLDTDPKTRRPGKSTGPHR